MTYYERRERKRGNWLCHDSFITCYVCMYDAQLRRHYFSCEILEPASLSFQAENMLDSRTFVWVSLQARVVNMNERMFSSYTYSPSLFLVILPFLPSPCSVRWLVRVLRSVTWIVPLPCTRECEKEETRSRATLLSTCSACVIGATIALRA